MSQSFEHDWTLHSVSSIKEATSWIKRGSHSSHHLRVQTPRRKLANSDPGDAGLPAPSARHCFVAARRRSPLGGGFESGRPRCSGDSV